MYYLFYYLARFAFLYLRTDYVWWGGMLAMITISNFIAAGIEIILGVMDIGHTDMYYFIMQLSFSLVLNPILFTEDKFEKYDEKMWPYEDMAGIITFLIIVLIIMSFVAYFYCCSYYGISEMIPIPRFKINL